MDSWYAWLSRTGLAPSLAHEYGRLFSRNELEPGDAAHFDHDLLKSMGIAVAKHRLEILKLARKETSSHGRAAAITVLPWRATRLLAAAVHRSASSALGRLRASVSRGRDRDRAAAVLTTPRLPLLRHRGGRVAHSWSKIASPVAIRGGKPRALPMLTRISKPVVLTNSCADKWRGDGAALKTLPAPAGSIAACLKSTDVCSCDEYEDGEVSDDEVVKHSGDGEEMRWESMFQDLKPT